MKHHRSGLGNEAAVDRAVELIEAALRKIFSRENFLNGMTSLSYFLSLLILGIGFWKSVATALIVLIYCLCRYGRQTIMRGGVVLMMFALAIWLELLPPLARWKALLFSLFPA